MTRRTFNDHSTASRLRDIMRRVADKEINRIIPPDRFGTVLTVVATDRRCDVLLFGDMTPISVTYGFGDPPIVGQLVRVVGRAGSRYIAGLSMASTGGASGYAYITVATTNTAGPTPANMQAGANYLGTGDRDDIVIQKAMDDNSGSGATVVVLPGCYAIGGSVTLQAVTPTSPLSLMFHAGAYWKSQATSAAAGGSLTPLGGASACPMLVVAGSKCDVWNPTLQGPGDKNGKNTGILVINPTGGVHDSAIYSAQIFNLNIGVEFGIEGSQSTGDCALIGGAYYHCNTAVMNRGFTNRAFACRFYSSGVGWDHTADRTSQKGETYGCTFSQNTTDIWVRKGNGSVHHNVWIDNGVAGRKSSVIIGDGVNSPTSTRFTGTTKMSLLGNEEVCFDVLGGDLYVEDLTQSTNRAPAQVAGVRNSGGGQVTIDRWRLSPGNSNENSFAWFNTDFGASVTAITSAQGTGSLLGKMIATITNHSSSDFKPAVGCYIRLKGFTPTEYNGTYRVKNSSGSTYKFYIPATSSPGPVTNIGASTTSIEIYQLPYINTGSGRVVIKEVYDALGTFATKTLGDQNSPAVSQTYMLHKSQAQGTVGSPSNAVTLPTSTLALGASLTIPPHGGWITVFSTLGPQQCRYTGVSGASVTGLSGGNGTLATGQPVWGPPTYYAKDQRGGIVLSVMDTDNESGLKAVWETLAPPNTNSIGFQLAPNTRFHFLDAPKGTEPWAGVEDAASITYVDDMRLTGGAGSILSQRTNMTASSNPLSNNDPELMNTYQCRNGLVRDIQFEACGIARSTTHAFEIDYPYGWRIEDILVLSSKAHAIDFDGHYSDAWAGQNTVRGVIVRGRPAAPELNISAGGSLTPTTTYKYATAWTVQDIGGNQTTNASHNAANVTTIDGGGTFTCGETIDANAPTSGVFTVALTTPLTFATFTYSGKSGSTLTGCNLVSGTGTFATGNSAQIHQTPADTMPSSTTALVTTSTAKAVTVYLPQGPYTTCARKVYRWDAGNGWKLVATISDNTTLSWLDDGTAALVAPAFSQQSTIVQAGVHALTASQNQISENILDGVTDNVRTPTTNVGAIDLNGTGGRDSDENNVHHNLIVGAGGAGVRIDGGNNNEVNHNIIKNVGFPGATRQPLRVEGLTGQLSNGNRFSHNRCIDDRDANSPEGGIGVDHVMSIIATGSTPDLTFLDHNIFDPGTSTTYISDGGTTTVKEGNWIKGVGPVNGININAVLQIAGGSGADKTSGQTYNGGAIANPIANQANVLFVSTEHGTTAPTVTPSSSGMTYVEIGTAGGVTFNGGLNRVQAFQAHGSAPTAGNLTITVNGDCTGAEWTMVACPFVKIGHGGADGIGQSATASGTGTSGSVTLGAGASSDSRTLAFFTHAANEVSTVGSGFTSFSTSSHTTPSTGWIAEWHSTVFQTAPSASWATSAVWGGFAVELVAAYPSSV